MALIKGLWRFNKVLNPHDASFLNAKTPLDDYTLFESNGTEYETMIVGAEYYPLRYGLGECYPYGEYGKNIGWIDEAYRLVDFGENYRSVTDGFYEWFTANATKFGSLAYKLETIAENERRVYDAGYDEGFAEGATKDYKDGVEAASAEFWDYLTNYGKRSDYRRLFGDWGGEYFHPTRKIVPTSDKSGYCTFNGANNLKKLESAYLDFSQKTKGTGSEQGYYYIFYNCRALEEIEDIGMQADFGYYTSFGNCSKLHTIAKIRCDEATIFNNTFIKCSALKNIFFEGVIGQSISFQHSINLSADSIRNIIGHLSDTASDKTLTLSKTAVEAAKTNMEFDDQAIQVDGTYPSSVSIRINPLNITPNDIPEGCRVKYELIVDDKHYIQTATWDQTNYGDIHQDPNYWCVGLWDYDTNSTTGQEYYTPNHRYTYSSPEIYFERYADNGVPAIFGIRAVIVDENGNEVTGENLYNGVVEVEGSVSDVVGFEALVASKPNWTISLV